MTEKVSLLCCTRLIRKLHRKGKPSEADCQIIDRCVKRIRELTAKINTLTFWVRIRST